MKQNLFNVTMCRTKPLKSITNNLKSKFVFKFIVFFFLIKFQTQIKNCIKYLYAIQEVIEFKEISKLLPPR